MQRIKQRADFATGVFQQLRSSAFEYRLALLYECSLTLCEVLRHKQGWLYFRFKIKLILQALRMK